MYVDPYIISWLLIGFASAAAFMIGYYFKDNEQDQIINDTIMYLINNNYVKGELVNGEWDIIQLDDENKS